MKNKKEVKSKRAVSLMIFFITFGFTIFLFYKIGPHIVYYFTKESTKGIVIEKNSTLRYKYLNENENKFIIRERKLSFNSQLNELKPGETFDVYYSKFNNIVYVDAEDSHFNIFLYLIGLMFCLLGCYTFFLAVIGKKDLDEIFSY